MSYKSKKNEYLELSNKYKIVYLMLLNIQFFKTEELWKG